MKNITKNGMPYKRKREGKTSYQKRLTYLKSGFTRVVIRRSLKNIVVQFVNFEPDGDKIILTTSSRELEKNYNLKGSRKNLPAGYLTGLLAGKKAAGLKIKSATPDLGVRKAHKKGVIFAVLKGLIDSGINIPHEEVSEEKSVFPDEERLKGEFVKNKQNYGEIKSKIIK